MGSDGDERSWADVTRVLERLEGLGESAEHFCRSERSCMPAPVPTGLARRAVLFLDKPIRDKLGDSRIELRARIDTRHTTHEFIAVRITNDERE